MPSFLRTVKRTWPLALARSVSARPVSAMSLPFAQKLRAREPLVGTLVTLGDAAVVELLSQAGYDWLFIDTEHAPLTARLPDLLRAAGSCPCLVRLPALTEAAVKNALDLGAAGVIAPQVNSEQQAKDLVRWSKYSPMGLRGLGGGLRAQGYGASGINEFVQTANEKTVVVAQIEHIDAVNDVEAIAAVPGIDALFIGPYDLSSSMGIIGQVGDKRVTDAVAHVAAVAQQKGVALGAFSVDAQGIKPFTQQGATLLTVGIDVMMLLNSARSAVAAVRESLN